MDKKALAEAQAAFLAKGGKVSQVASGEKKQPDGLLRNCRCGCEGDWTDHTMRQGEGRFRDQY